MVFTSCKRTVPCLNQFVTPAFVGFNFSDLDTLVIREYKKDDHFLTLIDTALFISDNRVLSEGSSNDTTIILLNSISGEEKYIFPDHDWQIYIPSQNRVVSISNFDCPQNEETYTFTISDLQPECTNPINSFLQDGQPVIPPFSKIPYAGGDFYMAYIHR